jgi:hypothetical protein
MSARNANDPHPVVQITIGLVVGLVGFGVPYACSGASLQLTPLTQCRLASLDVLPEDVNMATVYDAVDIIERLRKCELTQGLLADGGLP